MSMLKEKNQRDFDYHVKEAHHWENIASVISGHRKTVLALQWAQYHAQMALALKGE